VDRRSRRVRWVDNVAARRRSIRTAGWLRVFRVIKDFAKKFNKAIVELQQGQCRKFDQEGATQPALTLCRVTPEHVETLSSGIREGAANLKYCLEVPIPKETLISIDRTFAFEHSHLQYCLEVPVPKERTDPATPFSLAMSLATLSRLLRLPLSSTA
jgi:hypothetical protein